MKLRKAAAFALSVVIAAGISSGCGSISLFADSGSELEVVGTKERFFEIIEEMRREETTVTMDSGNSGRFLFGAAGVMEEVVAAPMPTGAPVSRGTGFSETNVQVRGVDEADLLKTDGKYIYYVMDGVLYIIKAEDGRMESVHTQAFENFIPFELYLDDEFLTVIGNKIVFTGVTRNNWGYNTTEYVTAQVYRLRGGSVEFEREVSYQGNYLSSRKIGKTLYLVTSRYLYNIEKLPVYRDSLVATGDIPYPLDAMRVIPETDRRTLLTVAVLDLSDEGKKADVQSFIGSADVMYMSLENLYIGAQSYGRNNSKLGIYKFALKPDTVEYAARGSVPGWPVNQFAFDEYEGNLRVATTDNAANNLFILNAELSKIGEITDIAPGERVYSVRFMGAKGYVVTFRQTDPLFAFDLSNPEKPLLLGALKIPGYSTYLHPYDENHLIGFGEETETNKHGGVVTTGLKMSMFDVSDLTNPKELFVSYIGDKGSTSPLLTNHKAILQSTERNIFAFPATEYKIADGYDKSSYGAFFRQGAYVYSIDMEEGFGLRGVISHMNEGDAHKTGYYGGYSVFDVWRIIYIGDYFYTISGSGIRSNRIDNLETVDKIQVLE